jgi:hypothetical protein
MKIEKNIAIPTGRKTKYNFQKMEVGDSILYSKTYTRNLHSKAYSACNNWSKASNHGYKFKVAKVEENGHFGVRIWRIK